MIVLSDGREGEVTAIAHNLERLYFLLSVLLNRVEKVDDTVKLRVTLIGDVAEFQSMNLRDLRWQQQQLGSFLAEMNELLRAVPRGSHNAVDQAHEEESNADTTANLATEADAPAPDQEA